VLALLSQLNSLTDDRHSAAVEVGVLRPVRAFLLVELLARFRIVERVKSRRSSVNLLNSLFWKLLEPVPSPDHLLSFSQLQHVSLLDIPNSIVEADINLCVSDMRQLNRVAVILVHVKSVRLDDKLHQLPDIVLDDAVVSIKAENVVV